jgi:predicted transcriptional regulator
MLMLRRSAYFCLSLLICYSCKSTTKDDSGTKSVIPVSNQANNDAKKLGQGFDARLYEFTEKACVTGELESQAGNASSEKEYTTDMDLATAMNILSGNIAVKGSFAQIKASVSMSDALSHSSSNYSATWTYHWSAVKNKRTLKLNSLKIDPTAVSKSETIPEMRSKCGDEYISEIQYGAAYMATLRIDFLSEKDKNEFKLATNIDLTKFGQGVSITPEVSRISEKIKQTAKAYVKIYQLGGNSTDLLSDRQEVICEMMELDSCMESMRNAINQGATLKNRLDKENLWSAIKYTTTSYQKAGLNELTKGLVASKPLSIEAQNKSIELENLWISALRSKNEISRIQINFGDKLTRNFSTLLDKALTAAEQNVSSYEAVLDNCYKNGDTCLSYWNANKATIRQLNVAELLEQVDKSFSDLEKCANHDERVRARANSGDDFGTFMSRAIEGPYTERLLVKGHHWNVWQIEKTKVEGNEVSVKGRMNRNIRGLLDDIIDYSCSYIGGNRTSVNIRLTKRNLNRGWESAASDLVDEICYEANFKYFQQPKCKQ